VCEFTLPAAGCYLFFFNSTMSTDVNLLTSQATLTFDAGALGCESFVETLSEGGGGPM
jgi:hypothetical protein